MRDSDKQAWKVGVLVAAVLAVVAVGAMSVMRAPPDPSLERAKAKKAKEDKKKKELEAERDRWKATHVAQVTRTVDCEWGEEDNDIAKGKHLKKGEEVDLLKGLAEITFVSGAQVILEGPARFTVVSRTSADLATGKMVADVPDDVQKFTINTPVATIVDAEFDRSEGTPDEPKRIRLGKGESIRLGEGDSVRID
ncbi:MAG: hypothetical protein MI757_08115 [Pirellulales bacterium]|nr:hypothetical protein [Pirellulales bacterium]